MKDIDSIYDSCSILYRSQEHQQKEKKKKILYHFTCQDTLSKEKQYGKGNFSLNMLIDNKSLSHINIEVRITYKT